MTSGCGTAQARQTAGPESARLASLVAAVGVVSKRDSPQRLVQVIGELA